MLFCKLRFLSNKQRSRVQGYHRRHQANLGVGSPECSCEKRFVAGSGANKRRVLSEVANNVEICGAYTSPLKLPQAIQRDEGAQNDEHEDRHAHKNGLKESSQSEKVVHFARIERSSPQEEEEEEEEEEVMCTHPMVAS